ncbi:hypothetical protein HU200_054972 [Digitaria exilis]|uniref:NAC domain-containing protein n=1 Tax=Digitaria exilis TaxID=1010633 RepID=A0A835E6H4_9POAL|nr:hypothetical protein HU200_054972 [Digitaria exilis]
MTGRHEINGHGAAAAVGGGGGGRAGDSGGGGGEAQEDDLFMPGFRFHPTEEELIEFYLRRKVEGKRFNLELITFLDLYRYDPWELPGVLILTEISLCRVYKRTGIDDGHLHPSSARSTPSRRGATAQQQQQQDIKPQASSSSTPTPPTTPSKMMHLLHGECTSPPMTIRDHHAAAAHTKATAAAQRQLPTKPPCNNGGYLLSTATSAAVGASDQVGGAAAMASSYDQPRNANAFASTYSLLSLVNAASMGGAAAIDELSSLVGHGSPAYFSHLQAGGGSGHSHSFLPLLSTPSSSSQPMVAALGTTTVPMMSVAAISDKIWEWNPAAVPDAAGRDYGGAGFK